MVSLFCTLAHQPPGLDSVRNEETITRIAHSRSLHTPVVIFPDSSIGILLALREGRMPANTKSGDLDDVNPEMAVRCSCDICMEAFDSKVHIPRVVRCGHSACQKCIRRLVDTRKNYKCPFCGMVTSVPEVEALPINRSLIDIVDFVRSEGQKTSEEETRQTYFCAHRTCFGGTRELKEMAVCKTQGCVQFRKNICLSCAVEHHQKHDVVRLEKIVNEVREKSRAELQALRLEATKSMREVYTLIGRANGMKEEMWQNFTSSKCLKDIIERSDQLNNEQEATELQEIGQDLIRPYTQAFSKWKQSLHKITAEMEELFGSEDEIGTGNKKTTTQTPGTKDKASSQSSRNVPGKSGKASPPMYPDLSKPKAWT